MLYTLLMSRFGNVRVMLVMLLAATGAGCATVAIRDAVPEGLVVEAQPTGLEDVRIWGDAKFLNLDRMLAAEMPALKRRLARQAKAGNTVSHIIAISGGADDGAFSAGLMVGWGESGTRPQFDLVTGISAGALVAPFVFLGADYDVAMSEIFTVYGAGDIYTADVLNGLLGGDALADSAPLAALIAKYVDRKMLDRVAAERAEGRLLFIGTTNIDAQRPVYWDMGRLAQSKHPSAVETFRKVLLASASVPGIFPPVRFPVTANGKSFEELHVDGGPTREVFFAPSDFSFKSVDKAIGRPIQRRLYIIRNGKLGPEFMVTKETTLGIAQRSLETLTKNQGIGDLMRMYTRAKDDKIDYNLIAIPDDFKAEHKGAFSQEYMRKLYATAFKIGSHPITWMKTPPGVLAMQ